MQVLFCGDYRCFQLLRLYDLSNKRRNKGKNIMYKPYNLTIMILGHLLYFSLLLEYSLSYNHCSDLTISDISKIMSKNTSIAIRLTRTPEVARALELAKKRYPTLSDPEILKVGLAKLITNSLENREIAEIRSMASYSVGEDYLNDPAEDIYHLGMGKKLKWQK